MAKPSTAKKQQNGGANLGFEATLWQAADKLRGHMDAAEYKHVVLGLIFLKYISDAFEEQHAKLKAKNGADPEDRDEYLATNIFCFPPEARWTYLQGRAKDPLIGKLLDTAMVAIERDNHSLKGVLPKNTAVVWPEYQTGQGRADFALCHRPSKPAIFIEVKQPGKAEDAVRQALEYSLPCHC